MTKKDEAFGLFGQGKTPDDPEVVALGLARASVRRYYRLWKQLKPQLEVPEVPVVVTPPPAPSEVSVKDIANGALFEYRGGIYKKRLTVYSGQVVVLPMHKAHYTDVFQPTGESVYLPPNVMVTPK